MEFGSILLPSVKSLIFNLRLAQVTYSHFLRVPCHIFLPLAAIATHKSTVSSHLLSTFPTMMSPVEKSEFTLASHAHFGVFIGDPVRRSA